MITNPDPGSEFGMSGLMHASCEPAPHSRAKRSCACGRARSIMTNTSITAGQAQKSAQRPTHSDISTRECTVAREYSSSGVEVHKEEDCASDPDTRLVRHASCVRRRSDAQLHSQRERPSTRFPSIHNTIILNCGKFQHPLGLLQA